MGHFGLSDAGCRNVADRGRPATALAVSFARGPGSRPWRTSSASPGTPFRTPSRQRLPRRDTMIDRRSEVNAPGAHEHVVRHEALLFRMEVGERPASLAVVRAFLKAGVMSTRIGTREATHTGTPHGGRLSPVVGQHRHYPWLMTTFIRYGSGRRPLRPNGNAASDTVRRTTISSGTPRLLSCSLPPGTLTA
jgi:hypothetical protein